MIHNNYEIKVNLTFHGHSQLPGVGYFFADCYTWVIER